MTDSADEDSIGRKLAFVRRRAVDWAVKLSAIPLGVFVYSLLGRYFYYAELLGNFRLQLLLMLVPTAAFLFYHRRWLVGSAYLPSIAWCMVGTVWIFIPMNQPPAGETALQVMSFNVLESNSQYDLILDQIETIDPDVVTLLEYSGHWHEALESLAEKYPHRFLQPRWHGFGIAIISKHPLSESRTVQLTKDKTDNPLVITDVTFGKQTIRLAALHVLSPTNKYRLKLRNQQYSEIAEILLQKDVPTVVMGDFNCTPWSPFLSDFQRQTQYRDSRIGFGYQASWHSKIWPLRIPIDHAFVSDQIHVHDRFVGNFAGSDHFPIVFSVSTSN